MEILGLKLSLRRSCAALVPLVISLAAAGCDGDERAEGAVDSGFDASEFVDIDTSPPPAEDIEGNELPDGGLLIEDLTVVENPRNSLSFFVEWTTARPATSRLEVECGGGWSQTYESDETGTDHRVFVMGLWSGLGCRATARSTTAEGVRGADTTTFEVGAPPSFLPDLEVKERASDAMQSGWTMVNYWNKFDDVPLTVAMFDARGRYRWYHQVNTSNHAPDADVRIFRDKVLIGGNRGFVGPRLVDWHGEVVWKDTFAMHHDIRPTADGKHLLYLTQAARCPQDYASDTIVEYDWKNHEEVWRSDFCDFYTPPQSDLRDDWSHLNTIVTVPGESNLLVSARNVSTLFKIDPENERLVWKMGLRGDFGLSGEELFYRQHAPEFQSNGNILLFDNGDYSSGHDRPWSRVVEISYDTNTTEAEIAWQYRPDPDIFAPIWGDADRLENGNTLATFGLRNRDPERNSQLIEVTADKRKVWHVEAPNKWGWYRSERLPEPPVGRVLQP